MFDFGHANEGQRRAIETTDGPVLITAGPGTGKTFTLVQRAIYLIQEKGIRPEEIMLAMGDALLQKTYTPNFLTHKSMVNNRAIRQYYVENSHPAIVDKETWKLVQKKITAEHKRKTGA